MAVWIEVVGLHGGYHLPKSGQRFPLVAGQSVVIGRGRHADIDLESLSVSRQHCKIHWDGCRGWLHDLSSPCGTYVNLVGVSEPKGSLLRLGDSIHVGGVWLRLGTSSRMECSWLTWHAGTIPRLAQAAHECRDMLEGTLDNTRLAILADALEEAGLTDEDILDHLRGPGPHVRGCFAVDLCLGKS